MLGRHADAFMAKQANERVIAARPNGEAQSIGFPDLEAPGTGKRTVVSGRYEMPGPQNQVDANSMLPSMGETAAFTPGIQPVPYMSKKDMLPGLGYGDMLPSMGMAPMVPGMGQLDLKQLAIPGAILGIVAFCMLRRKGA